MTVRPGATPGEKHKEAAMADDPTKDPATGDPKPEPKPAPEMGDAGKKALDDERKARRDAEKLANELKAKLQEIEDSGKSESAKLADRIAAAEKRAEESEARSLRLEVASAKGLTPAQAKRLVGATRDELEADADELVASFPAGTGTPPPPPPPGGKPVEDLKPGTGNPDAPAEETDIKKLGERMFT